MRECLVYSTLIYTDFVDKDGAIGEFRQHVHWRYRAESCPCHDNPRIAPSTDLGDLSPNVFSFPITVCPYHDLVSIPCLVHQVLLQRRKVLLSQFSNVALISATLGSEPTGWKLRSTFLADIPLIVSFQYSTQRVGQGHSCSISDTVPENQ